MPVIIDVEWILKRLAQSTLLSVLKLSVNLFHPALFEFPSYDVFLSRKNNSAILLLSTIDDYYDGITVPPDDPVITDVDGNDMKGLVGPFNEGDELKLLCISNGGKKIIHSFFDYRVILPIFPLIIKFTPRLFLLQLEIILSLQKYSPTLQEIALKFK